MSQAGNPEWYWYGVGRSFMNYNTRQTLHKAKRYHQALESFEKGRTQVRPRFNPMFHDFRGLFRHEFPILVHTQIYQVLMTTLDMVAGKFGLWTVLGHCTFDAYKLAPLVDETRTFTTNGPRQYHFDRAERKMNGNAARWWQGGVRKLCVNTDAPVVPQEELPYQAAMACWYGWLPYAALRGSTRVAAESLGLGDHMGSVEPGKDANLAIWTGDPIDPRSSCTLTFVNGKIVYDAKVKRRF
jgi:imidazolonepropionase-like amidohydrolase